MKKYLFLIIIILFLKCLIMANTTRDLKFAPVYNSEKIKKLIVLYLNLERVNAGIPALVINRKLNSAAQWHSDYMSEVEQLIHMANKKGMHDVQQRVLFFGEKIDRYAELLSFSYSLSIVGQTFEKKKDSEGEYIDFGKDQVYWLSETEIAMAMAGNIFKDSVYKNYLVSEQLNSIGGGISDGKSGDLKAWYGSFAIVEKTDLLKVKLKMNLKKEIIKKKENGKDIEETVLQYDVAGFIEPEAALLIINSAGVYRTIEAVAVDGHFKFRIDDLFRSKLAADEKIYVSRYDKENETWYPVMRVKDIN